MTTKQVVKNMNKIKNRDNEKWDMSIFNPKCDNCDSDSVSIITYHAYTHIPSTYICNKCGRYHKN